MRSCLLVLLVLLPFLSNARTYYINPSSDSTKELGTIGSPWRSLALVNSAMKMFKPGDSILLKRGELFFERLHITCSGTDAAPIVFSVYGTAAASPVFLCKGEGRPEAIELLKCRYVIIEGFDITDDYLSADEHNKTANIINGIHTTESDFISIRKMAISLVGTAISINGNNNRVQDCDIRSLKLIRNTVGGSDDYGAEAIVINGAVNTVSDCFFKDCWSNSYDYTYYGGVIKLSGENISGNRILNNTAINCDGFMEIAVPENGDCRNILAYKNKLINCGELLYIGSDATTDVSNILFLNNYVVHAGGRLTRPVYLVGIKALIPSKNMVRLRNNFFWINTETDIIKQTNANLGLLEHKNNQYFMHSGKLNYAAEDSESVLSTNSLSIKQAMADKKLTAAEVYPFVYILKKLGMNIR